MAFQSPPERRTSVPNEHPCCPRFNPEPWIDRELAWKDKLFVKDRVTSVFHVPLNFGAVMRKNMALIEAAAAQPEEMIVLSDENSLWGADVYIAVAKTVPGARTVTLSGTYLCRVFEGPYSQAGKWAQEMGRYIGDKGRPMKKLLFYYTTCPRCAKKHGKNYVVLLAQV
jgi:hypothetical protein